MTETTIPLTHVQLWIQIFAIFITVFVASGSAAVVVVRLFIKPITKDIETIKESQKDRKETIKRIESDMQHRVLVQVCKDERANCGQNRIQFGCLMESQIKVLSDELKSQDEKRQQAVKENYEMFAATRSEVAVLSSIAAGLKDVVGGLSRHSEQLEILIRERQNDFRPASMGDKIS